jgi:hypothetical protein
MPDQVSDLLIALCIVILQSAIFHRKRRFNEALKGFEPCGFSGRWSIPHTATGAGIRHQLLYTSFELGISFP